MGITERNRNFTVSLQVRGNSEPTFDALQELKTLGYAREDSTITLNGVCVPAGYCENFQQFIVTYGAIVSGNQSLIFDQVPESLGEMEAARFLAVCSRSMESQGRPGFMERDVRNFLEYREMNRGSKTTK